LFRSGGPAIPAPLYVDMYVAVAVIAPVMVAALVNGNEIVGVIDAVSDDTTGGWADSLDGWQRRAGGQR
jgi:hypothetical protein